MPVYLCRHWQGEVTANAGQGLAWVRPEALGGFAMPPADEPLKPSLPGLLRQSSGLQEWIARPGR